MPKGKLVSLGRFKKRVLVAENKVKADLVLKNARYINVFTETIETGDIVKTKL